MSQHDHDHHARCSRPRPRPSLAFRARASRERTPTAARTRGAVRVHRRRSGGRILGQLDRAARRGDAHARRLGVAAARHSRHPLRSPRRQRRSHVRQPSLPDARRVHQRPDTAGPDDLGAGRSSAPVDRTARGERQRDAGGRRRRRGCKRGRLPAAVRREFTQRTQRARTRDERRARLRRRNRGRVHHSRHGLAARRTRCCRSPCRS